MSAEYDDRILESGLEEVVGGHYPPDLTSTILQAWEARQQAAARATLAAEDLGPPLATTAATLPVAPPVHALAEPAPPPRHGEAAVRVAAEHRVQRGSGRSWLPLGLAVSLLAVAVLLGIYAARQFREPSGWPLAQSGVNGQSEVDGRAGVNGSAPDVSAVDRSTPVAKTTPRGQEAADSRPEQGGEQPAPQQVAAVPPGLPMPPAASAADAPRPIPKPRKPSTDAEVIAFINEALRQNWREHSVTPAPAASDEDWCDRAYLRLAGRHATSDELKQFVRAKQKDQSHRRQLVDRLLASDEFSRHWARLWTTALIGSAEEESPDSQFSRRALTAYLTEVIREDKPQEQIVFELLTASGANQPGAEDFNGAVNFLLAGAQEHATKATDRTARVFLGKQLVCTSCHAHPSDGWERGDFWELNAFFRQLRVERGSQSQVVSLSDADYPGESGAVKDAELFYRLPNGRLGMAYPELNGQAISHSGLVSEVNRRRELAKLVVASEDFRQAVVNRVWSWLFGYGFTHPVDDMGSHNPPSHPELLDTLAAEFAAHDFHTKGLVRWIVLSEPFGLSGKRMPESWMDAPESGGQPLFARSYSPPSGDRDVYKMLVQSVHQRPVTEYVSSGAMARRSWLRPSVEPPQIIETRPDDVWPGPAWLPRLARSRLTPDKKVEHLFLSVLARAPTPREMTAAKLVLADRLGDPSAIREIWRTLLAAQPEVSAPD